MRVKLQQEVDPGNPSWQFIHMIRYNVQLFCSTAPKRRNSIHQVSILISILISLPKLRTVHVLYIFMHCSLASLNTFHLISCPSILTGSTRPI